MPQKNPTKILTDIQRAARFFYLQQYYFVSKVDEQNWGYAPSAPVNLLRIEEKLSAAPSTYIENDDWFKVFTRFDRPDTFFYFDPPYWETAGYGVDFEWAQYERIAETMKSMRGKSIVSHKDHPAIRELFIGFDIEEAPFEYSLPSGDKTPKKSPSSLFTHGINHKNQRDYFE